MRDGELRLALVSALFFFLILFGYFLIRPVREAFGVSRGMDQLRWLFACTSAASLLVVLAFGRAVARMNRRRFIPAAYLFVVACLLVFAGLLISNADVAGSGAEAIPAQWIGYTFYIWLSVVNLFMTSVFWAFMVDTFDQDQGKRLFAFIGIGGTLGAFAGGSAAGWVGNTVDSPHLPAGLMIAASCFFAAAIVVMLAIDRMSGRNQASAAPMRGVDSSRFWEGLQLTLKSPYMLGIGLWVMFMAVSNTMIYFAQANIVLENTDTFSQRVAGFAQFDQASQLAVLLVQLFVTTHLVRKLGVGWTLAILPLATLAGFVVLAVWPVYGVMLIFQAVHRAGRHAVARPSREALFSVATPAEKYKAKPVVDVFLYRAGDLAGVGMEGLLARLGLGIGWMAFATAPLAAAWVAISVGLGAARARKALP